MKLSCRTMWLEFSCDVCNSTRDESQLSRDVTAAILQCFVSYRAMFAIHRAMRAIYRAMYQSYAMCAFHRAMYHSYRAICAFHRAMYQCYRAM